MKKRLQRRTGPLNAMQSFHSKYDYLEEPELHKAPYKVYHQGTLVYGSSLLKTCLNLIKDLNAEDRRDGVYTPGSYQLVRHEPF